MVRIERIRLALSLFTLRRREAFKEQPLAGLGERFIQSTKEVI
jgi:hypothetical protein